ncbi:unnamed protein product [Tuber aestivum]|uniref:Uncharacterized protein n=1 Tax=Tuber aestivum TaxID=59557 RepID=A0A292PQG8_9PEZI|nr:unnamed protein product [Tuber aestivum]
MLQLKSRKLIQVARTLHQQWRTEAYKRIHKIHRACNTGNNDTKDTRQSHPAAPHPTTYPQATPAPGSYAARESPTSLNKSYAVINAKLDNLGAGQKDLGRRFDRMIYFFVSVAILKGAFDFCTKDRMEQEQVVTQKR